VHVYVRALLRARYTQRKQYQAKGEAGSHSYLHFAVHDREILAQKFVLDN
jgi:hypothetical protein